MILPEITERKTVQVPTVGGIAKGTEICVMWRKDNGTATGCQQPVELFHGADDVSHVFDQVNRTNLSEHAVAEREREMIQIRDHIGPGAWIPIQAYSAGLFIEPAADIENRQLAYRTRGADGYLRFRG